MVSRSHDLVETLGNVVELVAGRLGAEACSVYLTEPDLEHLRLAATRGLASGSVGKIRLKTGEGLVGLVAREGRTMAFRRASEHEAYRHFPESGEDQFTTLVAAPLTVSGVGGLSDRTIGVLVVQTVKERDFSPDDLDLLERCVRLISPVVLNAQLLAFISGGQADTQGLLEQLGRAGVPLADREDEKPRQERNLHFSGAPTSRGIAIGVVHFLGDGVDLERVQYTPQDAIEDELAVLHRAVQGALKELHDLRVDVGDRFGPDFAAIFNAHIQILEDKGFMAKIENETREHGNALSAVRRVLDEYTRMFAAIEDSYFRERGIDVEDVGQRLVSRMLGIRHGGEPLPANAVLLASNLSPAHFATLESEKTAAIISEHGGATSHGAIFARALEIPAVTGVPGILDAARAGEQIIVDGETGKVILSPDENLHAEYRSAQQREVIAMTHLDEQAGLPAETLDGYRVQLTANMGLLSDLIFARRHGAEGVGLFRTELPALVHRGFPSEDEQYQLYEAVAKAMAPSPVTIRTLDLGGDKAIPGLDFGDEQNPQLGWRSIRLSLDHQESFRTQLRAILRAGVFGNLRILIPMVSTVEEIRRVREIRSQVCRELARRGVDFKPELPLGVMIEVPSAAVVADVLARECDFFSIGTNDLTQYTLAVDRGNERVAHLYNPLHPAVLTLIERSVRAAERAQIPVSLCGEMAGSPLAVPILVGMGLSELSVVASSVPVVREIVRALKREDALLDAQRALEAGSVREVHDIAAARLTQAGLTKHPDIGGWVRRRISAGREAGQADAS